MTPAWGGRRFDATPGLDGRQAVGGVVRAFLAAGASASGVPYPLGYAEVDELLKRHGT